MTTFKPDANGECLNCDEWGDAHLCPTEEQASDMNTEEARQFNASIAELKSLLKRYLINHCANADAEGMSALCECKLCLDTRAAVQR